VHNGSVWMVLSTETRSSITIISGPQINPMVYRGAKGVEIKAPFSAIGGFIAPTAVNCISYQQIY
jgi:hypothetical protein